jgi:hypothetical protein
MQYLNALVYVCADEVYALQVLKAFDRVLEYSLSIYCTLFTLMNLDVP